jgi:transcriptional regulator with XRE-family HTH domain
MADTLHYAPTGADTVAAPRELHVSRTRTIEDLAQEAHDLTDEAGHLRNVNAVLASDLSDVHHRAFRVQLETHTAKIAKRAPIELLGEINELGFGWRDIARMVGVSVPALRRWRQGESPTGEHRRRIAELGAFVRILGEDHLVADVASWMEMPITRDAPLTGIDLYTQGQLLTIFDLASEHITPDQALDTADPGWRERYQSDFEVFRAGDGQPAIRPRSTSGR